MKVLVTGATGFVGSFAAERFKKEGFDVRCSIRRTSKLRWVEGKGYELIEANFNSINSLKLAVEDVDYVVHIAGVIAARNYEEYLKGNRDSTKNLLEAIRLFTPKLKKFVYISSQTASGPARSLDSPVDENSPCRPITNYGKSKYEAEKVVQQYSKDLPTVIVRLPAIYGPRDEALVDMFKIVKIGFAPLIGFDQKYVSILHCLDAVDGIFLATTKETISGDVFFITSKEFYTWDYLMDCMGKSVNRKLHKIRVPHCIVYLSGLTTQLLGFFSSKPPVFNLEKAKDFTQKYWICSHKKALELLGFEQKISPELGMKETFDWYINNKWI
ncbi:MAG: NAD-dependent epimerase/dehydratase family protein [Candidatus Kapaibacteriales bacterium]